MVDRELAHLKTDPGSPDPYPIADDAWPQAILDTLRRSARRESRRTAPGRTR